MNKPRKTSLPQTTSRTAEYGQAGDFNDRQVLAVVEEVSRKQAVVNAKCEYEQFAVQRRTALETGDEVYAVSMLSMKSTDDGAMAELDNVAKRLTKKKGNMMLPAGWKTTTVGNSCAIRNTLRFPLSAADRAGMGGEYPYFGPTGQLDSIDHYRIDEAFALIGEDGDHFLKFRDRPMTIYFEGKANVNNHAHIIGNSEECLAKWFYYCFMRRDLTPVLSRQGVGRYKLTKAGLERLEFPLPPKHEQAAIVRVLSVWDQAIATTELLVANGKRQVEALLQQLLIKPAACGEWPMVPISEVSERIQRRANGDEELPVLMISSGSGFVRQDEKYNRFMAGKSVESYIALNRGEFAYNKGNSKLYEFGCVYPLRVYERGLVPNVYVCFKLSAGLNPAFYEHLFRADYLHDQLSALVNTGVRNNGLLNIRPADFLACQVPVPPLGEQRRIAELLKTASIWVEQHERDLDLLKQEKSALMSQILTGKRRVKLPKTEAETESQG